MIPRKWFAAGLVLLGCGTGRTPPAAVPAVAEAVPLEAPSDSSVPSPTRTEPADPRVEILWDTWGVPHIFARDPLALFWAFGWAQMRNHADLVLRLYGQARGRAAEYWGADYLDSDRWVRTNGIPERAGEWLSQQNPYIRLYLDAFAQGMNAFAQQYPEAVDSTVRVVLPVRPVDVLAHIQRAIHFTFMANAEMVAGQARRWRAGSNGWAIAPARSASGHAMLLANPHLPWGDLFTWFEAQLSSPEVNAYGAALVGFPLPGIAFNDHLGWTHTVNTLDGTDLFELTAVEGGYRWNGGVRPFETEEQVLKVRQPDGSLEEQRLVIRRSVHGPVVAEKDGHLLALRVAGLNAPGIIEQTWRMLRARDRASFEEALARLQIPMFTVIYADGDGNIMHVFNGRVPVRSRGDWRYWSGIVPGDSSVTLWNAVHAYADLPRVLDPESGWLQNANDTPWTTTLPFPLDPDAYPAYMAPPPRMAFRPERSARMLRDDRSITFEELIAYKHSTRVEAADHILEDVIYAARSYGGPAARPAADVLENWDRRTQAQSRGAILFEAFFRAFTGRAGPGGQPYAVPWEPDAPLATPDGIADPRGTAALLDSVAQAVIARYGSLDVAWGDIHRLRRDGLDLPANGGPGELGIFRVTGFTPDPDGRTLDASFGDSWYAAIEFSDPVHARALLSYGNASQPGSPHRTDQLPLYARQEMREVWRERQEIQEHLELIEAF